MRPHDDRSAMTNDEGLREVASILAALILRRHCRAASSNGAGRHCTPLKICGNRAGISLRSAQKASSMSTLVNSFREE